LVAVPKRKQKFTRTVHDYSPNAGGRGVYIGECIVNDFSLTLIFKSNVWIKEAKGLVSTLHFPDKRD